LQNTGFFSPDQPYKLPTTPPSSPRSSLQNVEVRSFGIELVRSAENAERVGKTKSHTFKESFSSCTGDSRLCSAIAATCWCCCNKRAPYSSFQKLLGLASPPPKASFNLGMSYNANMESFKHPSGQMDGHVAACFSSYFTRKRAPGPLKTRMNLSGL
jgi:hypothetical protein